MNWQERVEDGPTPQQMLDQITILQSQLRATDEENRRLRSLGETDVKEMVERALNKFELAIETIRMALKMEGRDERTGREKVEKLRRRPTDRLLHGRKASGTDTGQVPQVQEIAGPGGIPAPATDRPKED